MMVRFPSSVPAASSPLPHLIPIRRRSLLQRKCACGGNPGVSGECEKCREKRLQRKAATPISSNQAQVAPPIVHEVLRSRGQPLDAATRAQFEPRFGHSFANVRVHSDAMAAQSARAVNAAAYTVGREIVFNSGQYAPRDVSGQKLLAHELAHVIQQDFVNPAGELGIAPPNDIHEQEAEVFANQFLTKPSESIPDLNTPVSRGVLQRAPDAGGAAFNLGACGPLSLWINAFIPRNVPGYTYTVAAGTHAGETAIPCPGIATPVNPNCPWVGYLTDQRDFDSSFPVNKFTPSSRMRSRVDIDLMPFKTSQRHESSGTTEIAKTSITKIIGKNYAAGDVTCFQFANMGGCAFWENFVNAGVPITHDGFTLASLSFKAAGSDPCVNLAADIDYQGDITLVVNGTRGTIQVLVSGSIDSFPAFEMYASMNGVTKTIFTAPPPKGNTVVDLLGSANTKVNGGAEFACDSMPKADASRNIS